MPDGLTVKVDGDSTSLDAALDKSAVKARGIGAAVKESHEPLQKMGEYANGFLEKLTGFAAPLSAASAAMVLVGGAAEAWNAQLERARDIMREVTALHEKLATAGMGGSSVEIIRAMRGAADGLSNEEMGSVFQGTTGAAGFPNASTAQLVQAAKSAQLAKESGLTDVGSFAKTRASLASSGAHDPDSLAFYLERYAPETKDNALGAIRRYPDQGEDIAQLFQAAGREEGKGRKGLMQMIQTGLGLYGMDRQANPNSTTSFMDAMRGSIGARAAGDRPGEMNRQFLLGQVAQPVDHEEMERRALDNDRDPALHAQRIIERNNRYAAATVEEGFGAQALRRSTKASRRDAATADEPLGGFGLNVKAVTGVALGLLGLPIPAMNREAIEKRGYIDNGGDEQLAPFIGRAEAGYQSPRDLEAARILRIAVEMQSRRRLAAQHTQNGDR
jgi:hypothetical protein